MFGVDLVWKEARGLPASVPSRRQWWRRWVQNAPSAWRVGDGDEKFLLGKEILFNAVSCKVRADVVD